ncbi:hypothetical protein GTY75_09735 [Streptomyces sp. SID8381]|uniref:hypothetical protein n=1 Tax=unclassified Streptomyces TaxID=2593676 RepID=UPI000367EA0A|nr:MULTISPECIES: hypothetical protein [unclassified Streptomyces]MYX26946.1 hypothetical protein [Streptomyces sp. SID8381]
MDIAKALAEIDRLCAGPFPAEHTWTDTGSAGPGHRTAALATGDDFWEDDGSRREEAADQYECYRDGLAERLTERWGPPQEFSLYGVCVRTMEGEEVPEPWGSLSGHVPDVQLWRAPGTGRWIALGVSQHDKELPFQLLAVATDVDPP